MQYIIFHKYIKTIVAFVRKFSVSRYERVCVLLSLAPRIWSLLPSFLLANIPFDLDLSILPLFQPRTTINHVNI